MKAPGRADYGLSVLKDAKQDGDNLLSSACCDRIRGYRFKKGEILKRYEEDIFYTEGGQTLAQGCLQRS